MSEMARQSSEQLKMPGKCSVTGEQLVVFLKGVKSHFHESKHQNFYFTALEPLSSSSPQHTLFYFWCRGIPHSGLVSRGQRAQLRSVSRHGDPAVGNASLEGSVV